MFSCNIVLLASVILWKYFSVQTLAHSWEISFGRINRSGNIYEKLYSGLYIKNKHRELDIEKDKLLATVTLLLQLLYALLKSPFSSFCILFIKAQKPWSNMYDHFYLLLVRETQVL